MARTISRCWGVSVGAAHTREPRLSAASVLRDGECWSCEHCAAEEVLAMGKIFFYAICFLRIKEGVWEEYRPPVHGRPHSVDRQRRPVDIEFLPVNGQSVLVDMKIYAVNKEVCPVNMESSCRDANDACRQALSCGHANCIC